MNADNDLYEVFKEIKVGLSGKKFKYEKPNIVFLVGDKESGKTTQCKNILGDFDFTILSPGELIKQE